MKNIWNIWWEREKERKREREREREYLRLNMECVFLRMMLFPVLQHDDSEILICDAPSFPLRTVTGFLSRHLLNCMWPSTPSHRQIHSHFFLWITATSLSSHQGDNVFHLEKLLNWPIYSFLMDTRPHDAMEFSPSKSEWPSSTPPSTKIVLREQVNEGRKRVNSASYCANLGREVPFSPAFILLKIWLWGLSERPLNYYKNISIYLLVI